MKKTLYFYALIACLCVFWFKADITRALTCSTYTAGTYTLSNSGEFNVLDYPSAIQPTDTCSETEYLGIYPTGVSQGNGSGSCSAIVPFTYGNPMQMSPLIYYWSWWQEQNGYFEICDNTTGFGYYYQLNNLTWSAGGSPPGTAIGTWTIVSTGAIISISTPATGTTITDTATDLVGTWAGIDPAIYHDITLYFNSSFIGEQSVAKIILVEDWTGNFTIPLSYFGISANGQWDLKGKATYANTQLSDMYITPDIISPAGYNLIFDVEGFHTPYTFVDFDTWYGENVSNYETPSSWASGMIGFLQPILEKIAEFGARIQDYLDTSTAWQRGNDIGSVFPVINAYILKINMFFGGFPLAQFFQWGILIMIGMFAVKIILKLLSFIPVIGGGG